MRSQNRTKDEQFDSIRISLALVRAQLANDEKQFMELCALSNDPSALVVYLSKFAAELIHESAGDDWPFVMRQLMRFAAEQKPAPE